MFGNKQVFPGRLSIILRLSAFWLVPNWPISRLVLPCSVLIMLNLLKHHFWRKGIRKTWYVQSLYRTWDVPLYWHQVQTRIEYTEYQYKANEKHLISMVVNGGRAFFCPTKEQQPMGARRGTTMGGTWQNNIFLLYKLRSITHHLVVQTL